ncbi:uncharacterized protein LOC62_05G007164 [Vanrija pseudolonga]|uniref:Uncharacterized protein n=1 Tax=Vanrija pseudolonga TaxID=143232 RepID=A0AAF0YBF8_9TREE|nr:hypothetical protein LOC62_05G007164 [Vanrija pseudolonga]
MPVLSHALPVHPLPTSFAPPRQHQHQQATPSSATPSTPSTAVPPHYQTSSPLGLDAGPSTPWTSHGYFDAPHLQPPDLSPPGLARCSSEPPVTTRDMTARVTASRSSSRTPSLPASNDSRTDLKSLPVTPKASTPGGVPYLSSDALAGALMASVSTPASPCRPSHIALPSPSVVPSGAPQPAAASSAAQRGTRRHAASAGATPARSPLEQYTDLFLLEPHEYDSITDGELVRLYDRGILEWSVLEQIVDASIRIQRSCTDADRAVSIKIRRAMIRHALED